jgi:hypothetical protein
MVVVERPPAGDGIAQVLGPGCNRAPLEVVLLPLDALQLARLALLVADEDLDLIGESQEAAVEVACDRLPAAFGDTVGGLDGVVALVPAEKHDVGAVVQSAQPPRLLLLAERAPELAGPVRTALRLEPRRTREWSLP